MQLTRVLGGEKPLSDRKSLTAYAELVQGHMRLLDVVRQCRKEGRPDALKEYIAAEKNSNIPDDAARARRVLDLLSALR